MFFFMTYMLPKFMTIFQGLNVRSAHDDPNAHRHQSPVLELLVADAGS